MRLFKLTAPNWSEDESPYIKYVVASTISEALAKGSGFPGAADVVKVEELTSHVEIIE